MPDGRQPKGFRQRVTVSGTELVDDGLDLVERKRCRSVRVEHRGVVDVVRPAIEGGADGWSGSSVIGKAAPPGR